MKYVILLSGKFKTIGPQAIARSPERNSRYADVMQHFSNPSLQLMEGSPFEQFLVL